MTSTLMNSIMCWFAVINPGMPIRTHLLPGSASTLADCDGAGLLIVTVHTKLGLAMNWALLNQGIKPIFVGNVSSMDLRKNTWGSRSSSETIDAQMSGLFFRIDAALRAGRVVILFTDFQTIVGESQMLVSPNAFTWVGRMGYRLAYGLALAGRDGEIEIEFRPAKDDESAAGFARFLEARMPVRVELRRPKSVARPPSSEKALEE